MYNKTAILLIKNDNINPRKVMIAVKITAVVGEINPDAKGRSGELILSTSISKKSFKIIAEADSKKPHIKPKDNCNKEGKCPSVIISPIITDIPAAKVNSGRINSIKPFIFLQLSMLFFLLI
jgi:hypothetical protein